VPNYGLARVMSKRGFCSRSQAETAIRAGRVQVGGKTIIDPEFPCQLDAKISLDDTAVKTAVPIYLAINKPRGVIVSASDEKNRRTIFDCLRDTAHPPTPLHLSAVGRLDQASEGLLLISNDSNWAASITDPSKKICKTYHVQVATLLSTEQFAKITTGIVDNGERLSVQAISELRRGEKNCWLEIVLTEGKNRHIRRILAALNIEVLRLIRVQIGALKLGDLAKGAWREISASSIWTDDGDAVASKGR
jgi:23S rRNA pseudouridine2605 synthase